MWQIQFPMTFILTNVILLLCNYWSLRTINNEHCIHQETEYSNNSVYGLIENTYILGLFCYISRKASLNIFYAFLWYKTLNIRIYKTIILPFVVYGFETWSLTLKGERRLHLFENGVLRRIFGPRRV